MSLGAVDRLIAESRAEACAAGRKLALVYEIACATPVAEFAAVEVACALTLSRFAAERLAELASALCERLPSVLAALSNGDIDLYKARVFAEVLADLDVETARSVAALVLPKAPSRTASQVRDMLRRKAIAADPAYVRARRERAASVRSVQLSASEDGTASLCAFGLDATRASAAMQRISAIARERQFAGTSERAEQLRADVLLEVLEGKHSEVGRGVINLTVSLETLARWNDEPATLGGYGPIAADIARQWIAQHPGYQWQYAIHDSSGELLQQGLTRASSMDYPNATPAHTTSPTSAKHCAATGERSGAGGLRDEDAAETNVNPGISHGARAGTAECGGLAEAGASERGADGGLARPPVQDPRDRAANTAMTRWIRLRDKTCRAPGCRMPAAQCDLDHNQRHTDGGCTAHDNLCALCRYHHVRHEALVFEGGVRPSRRAVAAVRLKLRAA